MTQITCQLECGHQIIWGESPETPAASLPHVGMIAYCPECEEDQEIISCDPEQVTTETEQINGQTLHIFYSCRFGCWSYCLSGIDETDDEHEFESPAAAKEAAMELLRGQAEEAWSDALVKADRVKIHYPSTNPALSNDGGDYDHYTHYACVAPDAWQVRYTTSADFSYCDREGTFQDCRGCWETDEDGNCTKPYRTVTTAEVLRDIAAAEGTIITIEKA